MLKPGALAMQNAADPSGNVDYAYWARLFNLPTTRQADGYVWNQIFTMAQGIGIQGGWSTSPGYAGDAAYSANQAAATYSPGSNAIFAAIPLGSHPPSDPSNPTLAGAAAGTYNAYYAGAAQAFADIQTGAGTPAFPIAFWRLMWEAIGGVQQYPWSWSYPGQDQTNYARNFLGAWDQMAATALPIVPGGLIWNLNGDFSRVCPVWQDCWPGDTGFGMPIVGIDIYDDVSNSGISDPLQRWQQIMLPGLEAAQQFAEAKNAQICIPEAGSGSGGDNPVFWQELLAWIDSLPAGQFSYLGLYNAAPFAIPPQPLTFNAIVQLLSAALAAP